MSLIRMCSVALVIATVMVGGVSAQDTRAQVLPNGSTMEHGGMMGHGMAGGMMVGSGAMCGAMAGHIEGRLDYVKAELKITDDQESLWSTYASAARDNANAMLAHCAAMMSQHGDSTQSLPDRLEQNEQLMIAHLDAMRAKNKALKSLYAVLSDNQKKIAEKLFMGPMGMM